MADVKEMTVGLLFFGALVALGALTIMLSNFNPFQKTCLYEVYCDMANELKPQDNVLIMGTRQGKVEKVEFFERPVWCTKQACDLWVKVTLRMNIPLRLKTDYTIRIRNANLLGGKVMDIRLGRSGEDLDVAHTRLVGFAERDPVAAISEFVERNKGYVESILAHLDSTVTDVSEWADKISRGEGILGRIVTSEPLAREFESIVSRTDRLLGDALRDDNVLALLLRDPDTRAKIQRITTDLTRITGNVASGEGSLGLLVNDPELYRRVTALAEHAESISRRLDAGEGLAGRLLTETSAPLYEDVRATAANLNRFSQGLVEGRGLLHDLVYDEALSRDLRQVFTGARDIASDLAAVARNLKEGKGALGMLLNDPKTAEKLKKIVSHILDGLEDAREAAPVRSLGSFLFGAY